LGHIEKIGDARIAIDQCLQIRIVFDRLIQSDVQFGRYHFRDLVDFRIRHVQTAAGIAQYAARGHRSKRDDLRHVFPARTSA
jgi:hypothetical protein